MTDAKIRSAAHESTGHQVITVAQTRRQGTVSESQNPILINLVIHRWRSLIVCIVLSVGVGGYLAVNFRLPKAVSTGQLRSVPLPPAIECVYQAPSPLELAAMVKSNDNMAELSRRHGLAIELKDLGEKLDVSASRYSNIIEIELKWSDAKQAIDMVNELMEIACATTVANRIDTLKRYRGDMESAFEKANARVAAMRAHAMEVRGQRDQKLGEEDALAAEPNVLMAKVSRTEELLDSALMRKRSLEFQLASLEQDAALSAEQVKRELIQARMSQIDATRRAYKPDSPRMAQLDWAVERLQGFKEDGRKLEQIAWRSEFETLLMEVLGELDEATLDALDALQRRLDQKTTRIDQLRLERMAMDGEINTLENRRLALESRLADSIGIHDLCTTTVREADRRSDEAQAARSRIHNQLETIRRLEETQFREMYILTKASWQTTETSDGRTKLMVLGFAGGLFALLTPVLVWEHFFPAGDPSIRAALSLGLPLISRHAFVRDQSKRRHSAAMTESIRLLALRLQQNVQGSGSLVLFSGLGHRESAIPTISCLAECLARREERVLIIDAWDQAPYVMLDLVKDADGQQTDGASETEGQGKGRRKRTSNQAGSALANPTQQSTGLADFLHGLRTLPENIIRPTVTPGVDVITRGSTTFPCEALGARRLTALLDECRQRYSLILMAGPSTDHPSDLQMLSARADGIVFTVSRKSWCVARGEAGVRELIEMQAPIIGIVG